MTGESEVRRIIIKIFLELEGVDYDKPAAPEFVCSASAWPGMEIMEFIFSQLLAKRKHFDSPDRRIKVILLRSGVRSSDLVF